jgi:S1-C subfamily serine protease
VLLASLCARVEAITPEAAQKFYEQVTPSLVVAKYTWESELGRRELSGAGIVVRDDGLVIVQLAVFNTFIPDEQLKDFKIVVPDLGGGDPDEIDARLDGRDERYNLVFLRPKDDSKKDDSKKDDDKKDDAKKDEEKKDKKPHKWVPIKFEDANVKIGDPVFSIGLLPEMAAYKTYFVETTVAATLRGEQPQVLVQGGLTAIGSPVFTPDGKAVGIVEFQAGQTPFLNDPQNGMNAINNPPKIYIPARDFLPVLSDPPKEGTPIVMPWIGVPQLTGVSKDVAEVFNLTNQPAIQIGEVIPNAPSEKAGLKRNDILVKIDGKPLERGDTPEELPQILRRQLMRMKVGQTIKLSVLRGKGTPLKDIEVKLEEMPKRQNTAKRWYAEDLGFSSREIVFTDTYARRLKPDAPGVIVALIRPQSAAESAGLKMNDLITELNREPVKDLESFRKSYEEFRKNKPKEAVVMVVLREGNTQTIRIEPPQ